MVNIFLEYDCKWPPSLSTYPDVVGLVEDLRRQCRFLLPLLLLLRLLLLLVGVVAHEDSLVDSPRVRDVDGFMRDLLRLQGPQDVILLFLHLMEENSK